MKKYIFIIILLFAISYILFVGTAYAQYKLETGLPNVPELPAGQEFPSYIKYLFIFGLSLVAFLALAQMMLGGLTYILAAGNVAKVEDAKNTIQQALLGLGLLLVSYLLLYTINPDLVNLRNPSLAPTQFKGSISEEGKESYTLNCSTVSASKCGNYSLCEKFMTEVGDLCAQKQTLEGKKCDRYGTPGCPCPIIPKDNSASTKETTCNSFPGCTYRYFMGVGQCQATGEYKP